MNIFPAKPHEDLLIDALRTPAPRPVRYSPRVRIIRVVLLNGWIAALLIAHLLLGPLNREGTWLFLTIALLSAGVFLLMECHFRWRRHLLACGEATVGVVLSREAITSGSSQSQVNYFLHYRYWGPGDRTKDATVQVSKRIYEGCPDGCPITVLYDRRFRNGSLPLVLLREAEFIPQR